MNWTQEDYFYEYYEETCDEKDDTIEVIVDKSEHLKIEQAIGVFIMFVAVFIALFRRILLKNREFYEEKYKDTMEDELDDKAEETCADVCSNEIELVSTATKHTMSCCGKVFRSRVKFAIHIRKSHRKCSCYLETASKLAQCNDCHFKYPIRTHLGCHISIKHEIFEGKATEIKLETNKEGTNYKANARKVKK